MQLLIQLMHTTNYRNNNSNKEGIWRVDIFGIYPFVLKLKKGNKAHFEGSLIEIYEDSNVCRGQVQAH